MDKAAIRHLMLSTGANAVGFARAETLSPLETAQYTRWVESGMSASMEWTRRHASLRRHPESILPDVSTVISLAFTYGQPPTLPGISLYAHGTDYHRALRRLLRPVCQKLEEATGCTTRICVDSAPLAERHYAVRSGIAMRGLNGCAIVPGVGSQVFLAEVLTTLAVEPDEPCTQRCGECRRCLEACPTGALQPDGTLDSRRCISYLTTAHKGPLTAEQAAWVEASGMKKGCDACQTVCPHNARQPRPLPCFLPHPFQGL